MIKLIPYISYKPVAEFAVEEQMKSLEQGRQTVFIVPESVKASVERLVFDRLVKGRSSDSDIVTSFGSVSAGSLNVDVLSFVRLSYKILSMTGRESDSDDMLLRNVIYRVLTDAPADFPNLNKLRTHFEYIDMLVDLIGDFRRYDIGVEKIRETIGAEGDSDGKLSEVALLIERVNGLGDEFNLPINENLPDTASKIIREVNSGDPAKSRRLSSLISFLKSRFVIVGLGSSRNLTPQELRLIKSISDAGGEVVVYAAARGEGSDGSFSEFGENTIAVLEQMDGTVGTVADVDNSFSKRVREVAVSYADGDSICKCQLPEDGSVELVSYAMADDAISYVANEINRLVRDEQKYRFSDIHVLCIDDSYKERIKNIFKLFDLQMFIDSKVVLMNTPVVWFVMGVLDLSIRDYNADDVLRLLRTGVLTGARADIVDVFDNYLLRENIRDKNRLFNENFYKLVYDDSDGAKKDPYQIYDNGELIYDGPAYLYEHIVRGILVPIRNVTDEMDARSTLAGKAEVLARYIGSLKNEVEAYRDEYLLRGENDTALAIVKGYQEIMNLLTSFTGDINDTEISREQFASLIRTDMKNKASGSIPLCADSVEIASTESSVYTPCKVLFILGATSSNFPHKPSREGIIPSNTLQSLGLPDKAGTRSKQEFIEAASILNSVEDKLVMIHPASEIPSPIFNYYRTAFSLGDDEYAVPVGDYVTPVYGNPVERRHVAEDSEKTFITPEHMRKLLDKRMICSVTSIENYNGCPLKYMLDYALRIKVRTDGTSVASNELGTLCHSMFEFSMKDVKSELETKTIDQLMSEADDGKLSTLAQKYFSMAVMDEQIKNPDKYSPRYAVYPGLKAKRIFEKAYPAFLEYFKTSGYRPDAFELELQKLDNTVTVKTEVNNIEFDFQLKGSIDRVDRNEDGLLRVVDYKTYDKKINYTKVAEGVQIQLFLYAYGLELQPENRVDNVGYILTYLPTSKDDCKDPFKYVTAEKSGNSTYDIRPAFEHSYKMVEQACNNISQGKATVALTASEYEEACTFCNFKGACGRNVHLPRPVNAEAKALADSWKASSKGKKKNA